MSANPNITSHPLSFPKPVSVAKERLIMIGLVLAGSVGAGVGAHAFKDSFELSDTRTTLNQSCDAVQAAPQRKDCYARVESQTSMTPSGIATGIGAVAFFGGFGAAGARWRRFEAAEELHDASKRDITY